MQYPSLSIPLYTLATNNNVFYSCNINCEYYIMAEIKFAWLRMRLRAESIQRINNKQDTFVKRKCFNAI